MSAADHRSRAQAIADRRASRMRAPARIGLVEDRDWYLVGYNELAGIGESRDREALARLTPADPAWSDNCACCSTFEGLEVLEGHTLVGELADGVAVEPARWVEPGAGLEDDPAFQRLLRAIGLVDS